MKTPIGEMRITEPGVLIHELDEGVAVAEGAAAEVKRITEALAAGDPVVVIVDMRAMAYADRDVRDAFSTAPGAEVGTALVVKPGLSEDLAGLFTRFHNPDRPVEVFVDMSEAENWARTRLQAS